MDSYYEGKNCELQRHADIEMIVFAGWREDKYGEEKGFRWANEA